MANMTRSHWIRSECKAHASSVAVAAELQWQHANKCGYVTEHLVVSNRPTSKVHTHKHKKLEQ